LILDLDINLRAIKDAFTGIERIGKPLLVEGLLQGLGGLLPVGVTTDIFFRPGGEIDIILVKAEGLEDQEIQVEDIDDLIFKLIRLTEDMGIILSKATDPQQAVQGAGTFIAIDSAQFAPADGKLAITPLPAVLDADMKRAVHRFELILHLVDGHRRVHVLPVEIKMA
jgi:hypothetical protein